MVAIYQVEGPIAVQWAETAAPIGAYAELGHCPNRERPQFSTEWLGETLGDDEHGDEVVDIVHTGKIATLQFTLSRWDNAEVEKMLSTLTPGTTLPGTEAQAYDMGVIGTLHSGQTAGVPDHSHLVAIKLLSVITGREIRTFEKCYALGDVVKEFEIGNTGTQLAFIFNVMRNQDAASPVVDDTLLVKTTA